jgi:hypothetical protein
VALYDAKGDLVSAAKGRTTLDRLARARSA